MTKLIKIQFYVLLGGTLFAWANFGNEVVKWLTQNNAVSCSGTKLTNPFITPCFGGAIFFTIAFVLSVLLMKECKTADASK